MNKKMGIIIRGLMEYAEICLGSEIYQELDNVLNIAFTIVNVWELSEIDKVIKTSECYRNMAREQIKEDITKIEKEVAQSTEKLTELKAMYFTLLD